jgi:hypothetical protein
MDTESAFRDPEEVVEDLVRPTDVRPDFCAEALSPGSRIGLLLATFLMIGLMLSVFISILVWPDGMAPISGFAAVEVVGGLIVMTFLLLLIFGALAANNPRLTPGERGMWFAGFALAAPLTFPAYWFVHISPVPYQPTSVQRL